MLTQVHVFNNKTDFVAELTINGVSVCLFGFGRTEELAKKDLQGKVGQFVDDLRMIDRNKMVYVDDHGAPVVIQYAVEMRFRRREHKPLIQIYRSGKKVNTPSVAHLDISGICIGLFGFGKTEKIAKNNLREKITALIQELQTVDYNKPIYVDGLGNPIKKEILEFPGKRGGDG